MMISDNINWYDHGGYTEMTASSLNVNATDEDKSKRIITHEGLSESCSTNKSKWNRSIVSENVLQKISADVSEYTIRGKKDEEYKESEVTK